MKKIYIIISTFLITSVACAQNELYNNGTILHINTGCTIKINGNLTNTAGSTLTNNGTLTITGNSTSNQIMAVPNNGTLELTGSTAQSLSGTATYFAKNVLINNAAGVTLNTTLKADGLVTFTNGIVTAAATSAPMLFTSNATVAGVADASHVNGYVVKEGTGAFTYPVGDGTKYQKVDVNSAANATGIQVKYNAADAGAGTFTAGGTEATPLLSYNTNEYWDITPLSTATGTVTVYWDGYNDAFSNTVSQRKVAHKTGGNWLNEGSTATGTTAAGSVTSNAINTWSPFAMGSISSVLPLSWVNVSGSINSSKQAVLSFKVNENNVAKYEIEKSNDGRTFNSIADINSKGNGENSYQFTDAATMDDVKYYRIKQIDADGRYSYSTIIRLSNNVKATISIYPNPVKDVVTISGLVTGTKAVLTDVSGKVLQQIKVAATSFTIDMSKYYGGVYLLKTQDGRTEKIIKQ
ncbi:T9SS type A sorting domain-containing protein [Ferruginibacter sp.]|nr:T9SS type A sorting domain-containing protein [Ferruginibacter sp.]